MADSYSNVPVFRTSNYASLDDIIGSAQVVISESGKTTIVMEVNKEFTDFLQLGDLKALNLSGYVSSVDSEKAKAYWSGRQR